MFTHVYSIFTCYIALQIKAACLAATADSDKGVHLTIQHTDMRTLWHKFYDKLEKVCVTCT